MEPDVVDAVSLAYLHVASPRLHVHRHMCGVGEHAGVMLSAQECGLSVHGKLCAVGLEIHDAEGFLHRMPVFQLCVETVGVRVELAPQFQVVILVFYCNLMALPVAVKLFSAAEVSMLMSSIYSDGSASM